MNNNFQHLNFSQFVLCLKYDVHWSVKEYTLHRSVQRNTRYGQTYNNP